MAQTKRQFRVDFDGNAAQGSIGQTVQSTMGDAIRFVKFWQATNSSGQPTQNLLIKSSQGGPCSWLINGEIRRGQLSKDFEIIN